MIGPKMVCFIIVVLRRINYKRISTALDKIEIMTSSPVMTILHEKVRIDVKNWLCPHMSPNEFTRPVKHCYVTTSKWHTYWPLDKLPGRL